MPKEISAQYWQYLDKRQQSALQSLSQHKLRGRGFWTGSFLSFFLATGDPYGNMVIRGSYMANDFNTPGAIFLFLFLIGVLNLLFKVAARNKALALAFAGVVTVGWFYAYQPFYSLDPYSPGLIFSTFLLIPQ